MQQLRQKEKEIAALNPLEILCAVCCIVRLCCAIVVFGAAAVRSHSIPQSVTFLPQRVSEVMWRKVLFL